MTSTTSYVRRMNVQFMFYVHYLASRYIPVQSQQYKHCKKMWNLLKVNHRHQNHVIEVVLVSLWTDFTLFWISFVDFDQVNAGWVNTVIIQNTEAQLYPKVCHLLVSFIDLSYAFLKNISRSEYSGVILHDLWNKRHVFPGTKP